MSVRAVSTGVTGTYTPTLTPITNVAASTPNPFIFTRVNDMVTVTGLIAIDPTAASVATVLQISLPVSSVFTAQTDGCGVGNCSTVFGMCGAINASAGNNAVRLGFVADAGAANQTWGVFFQYQVK